MSVSSAPPTRNKNVTLESWMVENFKAVDFAELPLRGLVTLVGANSSGKSSLLQSILMLAQSGEGELNLNGNLVRLGMPRDVIRHGESVLSVACQATIKNDVESVHWVVELKLKAKVKGLKVSEISIVKDGAQFLQARDGRVTERTHGMVDPDREAGDTILRVHELNGEQAPPNLFVSFNGLIPSVLHIKNDQKRFLSDLRRAYPHSELRKKNEVSDQFAEIVFSHLHLRGARREEKNNDLATAVSYIIDSMLLGNSTKMPSRDVMDHVFRALSEKIEDLPWQAIPLRSVLARFPRRISNRFVQLSIPNYQMVYEGLAAAQSVLNQLSDSVRYLGPLREEPQVLSKSGSRSRHVPVGPRGELTAELLSTRTKPVRFQDWKRSWKELSLKDAVSLWASYLGIGEDVSVEDQGKLGRGLRIRINGASRDLTMVGVGASQLLPVLAVILDAPSGSVVMLEQPELHLHPRVQSALGDFLLFARPDICVVIETHSEYLITRIRRRVAEQIVNSDDVNILFAESAPHGTEVRQLYVTELGNLNEWPEGFFEEQELEARAIVQAIVGRER